MQVGCSQVAASMKTQELSLGCLNLLKEGGSDLICKRESRPIQSAPSETRDCQSGFNLLNALESGFHGHSGSGDIALHVSEHIARLVPLNNGEFSRG